MGERIQHGAAPTGPEPSREAVAQALYAVTNRILRKKLWASWEPAPLDSDPAAREAHYAYADAIMEMLSPAPCDEPAKREDAIAAEGRSPAGAVGEAASEAEAPDLKALRAENERLKHDLDTCSSHNVIHQELVKNLRTALAESERKRVEALKRTTAFNAFMSLIGERAIDPAVRLAIEDLLDINAILASTPTQEIPSDQG